MHKLLIDTCVWLDLAKTTKGEEVLMLLEEFINSEKLSLVVPSIVVEEFHRNKERIIQDACKSVSSHFKKVKELIEEHSDPEYEDKKNILNQLNDIDKRIPTLGENAVKTVKHIEALFATAEILPITNEIKLKALDRGINKKAPFHLSKNSTGDAIIIETYDDYKIKNQSQDFNLVFITHNINDFSVRSGNQKYPHEDISYIFNSKKSQYFINLPEALNSIDPTLITQLEYIKDWDFNFRNFSEITKAEEELVSKVWYSRHKYREHLIQTGKIKLVKDNEYEFGKSQGVIIDHIWEGALSSAKKVEELYGIENLEFDAFEWGMINGKLSALRWVIGDEWDNLDT